MAGSPPLSVAERIERLELPFEASGYDAYGTSRRALERAFRLLEPWYRHYFRVRCHHIERIPPKRAILIPNHSGGMGIDAALLICACFFELDPPRLAQGMADRFLNRLPFASLIASRTGQLTGLPEHAERLLNDERLLLIFPEGVAGTAKRFWERRRVYDLPTGFLRLAMKTQSPIVPVGILGAGEALPTVLNLEKLGQWFGVPYLPVTPYLLPFPLPARFDFYFGEALHFSGTGNEDDSVIGEHVRKVKSAIESLLEQGSSGYRVL